MSYDYQLLKEAGVKPRHIHRLLGVSRVTASNWLRGVTQPHALVKSRADVLIESVKAAVEDDKLPVPASFPADERSVRTAAIIKRYMAAAIRLQNAEAAKAEDA